MKPKALLPQICALIWIFAFAVSSHALNRLAIDGIHGQQNLDNHVNGPYLPDLYPDSRFTFFGAERLPLYNVITEGATTQNYMDTVTFEVAPDADALYVIVSGHTIYPPLPPWDYPFVSLVLPDESIVTGAYGFTHVDSPPEGEYTLYISHGDGTFPYQIGTGPRVWDVYPPDDFDAVLDFHNDLFGYWTGTPPRRSEEDFAALEEAITHGMGIGLFYDCGEPIADKPIIKLRGMAAQGAQVSINVPGRLTLAIPEPTHRSPLSWTISPTTADVELDYEVQLRHPLNFVWAAPGSGTAENNSWATLNDLLLISFEFGKGYRIGEAGSVAPTSVTGVKSGGWLPFEEAYNTLNGIMRADAIKAGLTADETESFFARCNWPLRVLSRVTNESGQMALYYITGSDYDALFPLQTNPVPAEIKRVLWVHSFIPARVNAQVGVHPQQAIPQPHSPGIEGAYHEYGALRETYGGDRLDDMDAWGWHCYDSPLVDETNPGYAFPEWGTWGSILYHTPGASPLTSELLSGVTELNGAFTNPIEADASEVVLSGDNDTYCEELYGTCPFPQGSYPPVVVARQVTSGARIVAAGDLCFLDSLADNHQFGENLWNALHGTHTENVPDIDVEDAIIDYTLTQGQIIEPEMIVFNRGDVTLQTNFNLHEVEWLSNIGTTPRSIGPNSSYSLRMQMSAVGLEPGYYFSWWQLNSDDPNESELQWPVRLRVLAGSAVDPTDPALPNTFELYPPIPNPFNATTSIRFYLPRESDVALEVHNLMGQSVATLVDGVKSSGDHTVQWNAQEHASGVYVCQLRASGTTLTQKLVLIK